MIVSPGAVQAPAATLVRDAVPAERVVTGEATRPWSVVGRAPRIVAFPTTAAEVASLVSLAREEHWALEPAGAGRWLAAGNPGRPPDLVVSVARMDDVVEYEPGDLTLSARAGLTLDALARRAGAEGQWLAADPPGAGGTLGALVATASAGPLQAGFGQPRDQVLGLEVVTGEGRILRLGGRVLKNVAGFDLVRLMTGSRGTLGVLTSVTVRLHPLPLDDRTWVLEAERAEDLLSAARRVATAGVSAAAIEIVERRGGGHGADRSRLAVRLLGPSERIEAEAAELERAAGRPLAALDAAPARSLWRGLRGMEDDAALVVRMAMPPAAAASLLHVARALGRVRGGRDELGRAAVRSALHVTSGVLRVAVPNLRTHDGWDERWGERLRDLRRTLEARGGSLSLSHGPAGVVEGAGAWGDGGAAARLMRGIKGRLDPDGVLSPGRFVIPDEAETSFSSAEDV